MAILAEEVFSKTMSPDDRERAAHRADDLIEQYLTLQQLRKARKLTQVQLGSRTGKDQVAISHIEKRTDMLLSTVRTYVEAMGGTVGAGVADGGGARLWFRLPLAAAH